MQAAAAAVVVVGSIGSTDRQQAKQGKEKRAGER